MDRTKEKAMIDERELVRRIQDGDASAFRELVEEYKQQVYYLALDLSGNHHDAEDLSQEVFIKAYRGFGRFRSGSKIGSWLHRITVNAYIDSKRKKAHKMVTLVDKKDEDAYDPLEAAADDVTGNPERAANSAKINEHVEIALQTLSDKERSVFVLRHYHDMQLKEIAETLEVAEGSVKSLLFRAVRKLRDNLTFYREDMGMEGPAK
ncbi:MAG: sigma-70 family RNA polymerase sigma factor [Candidatus Latescibacterota bacterium]|jgi:RNA polymerase sigma-70 factor (ECF subfamily)